MVNKSTQILRPKDEGEENGTGKKRTRRPLVARGGGLAGGWIYTDSWARGGYWGVSGSQRPRANRNDGAAAGRQAGRVVGASSLSSDLLGSVVGWLAG